MSQRAGQVKELCVHCGNECTDNTVLFEGLSFCCHGCKTVFQVLSDQSSGKAHNIDFPSTEKFEFLDEPEIAQSLVLFSENGISKVRFNTPAVHCSSCIQILEKLNVLHSGILTSRIDFPKRQVTIDFCEDVISLRRIADLLTFVGYPPVINLSSANPELEKQQDKRLLLQIGTAGFIFGNVMLLSFPEYLGLKDPFFERLFGYLSIAFTIPLLTFSASDYIKSAYTSLLNRSMNIDVPISLGALTLFLRSVYDIVSHSGSGYLDSLAGFIFFLLIGKWFQKKTYDKISFNRNYESYFPLYATVIKGKLYKSTLLKNLRSGDNILIRHHEIVPCDSELLSSNAQIDYSFVTGEERPIPAAQDDKVFAGGRNLGTAFEVKVLKQVDQSYLTKLWEDAGDKKEHVDERSKAIDSVGRYFTISILSIALLTLIFWMINDPDLAMHAFTSVLIIACPCVIALSIPFTFGSLLSMLGTRSVFIRGIHILEKIQSADTIVFDKTGTLTSGIKPEVHYKGHKLSFDERQAVSALVQQSSHPLSQFVFDHLGIGHQNIAISDFIEESGKGIAGNVNGMTIKIGSAAFVDGKKDDSDQKTMVFLSVNDNFYGSFNIQAHYRTGLISILSTLRNDFSLFLLSGDKGYQSQELSEEYGFEEGEMLFERSPQDKKEFIHSLRAQGQTVMMIGDGLNDAGALMESDVGVVITEDLNNFTPASDVVLESKVFEHLPEIISLIGRVRYILFFIYAMAILYNGIGLFFAVQGLLSPVVAAILMPASSISMVVIGYGLTLLAFKQATGSWHFSDSEISTQSSKLSVA